MIRTALALYFVHRSSGVRRLKMLLEGRFIVTQRFS